MVGLRSIGLALGFAALFGGAWLFRYEPRPLTAADDEEGVIRLWDRIGHRECIALQLEATAVTDIACTPDQLVRQEKLSNKLKAERRRNWERMTQLGGDHSDGAAEIRRFREAGFSRAEVSDWIRQLRTKFTKAGIPNDMADVYFGGAPGEEMPADLMDDAAVARARAATARADAAATAAAADADAAAEAAAQTGGYKAAPR